MKKLRKITTILTFALLTGCNSYNLKESDATKEISSTISKNWNGHLMLSDQSLIDYFYYVDNVEIDFLNNNLFHDVKLTLNGKLIITESNFEVSTPMKVVIKAHSKIEKETALILMESPFAESISFKKLYKSYSLDLVEPLKESFSKISDSKLMKLKLGSFKDEKEQLEKELPPSKLNSYTLIKENNGDSITIKFKEN